MQLPSVLKPVLAFVICCMFRHWKTI